MPNHVSPSPESIARIDELVHQIDGLPDPRVRAAVIELVQAVMGLHKSAFERMLEIINDTEQSAMVMDTFASDELVSSVLVLHGLHPDDLETRVHRALDQLCRHFHSRGAGIKLLEFDGESVRVRFTGTRPGAGPAARPVIENVFYQAAPEITNLIIEGAEEREHAGFVPLSALVGTSQP